DGKTTEPERVSDVRVVTLAVYRADDEGYPEPDRHSHIWTMAVPAATGGKGTPKRITSGPYAEGAPVWSLDGQRIYFNADRNLEPYYELPTSSLYSVPASGGEVARLVSMEGVVGPFRFSSDGRSVAFIGAVTRPARSYDQPRLFVTGTEPGAKPRVIASDLDRDLGSGIIG